ncbi:hypothetical protein J3Q64DRAFT_1686455 [Phycomyces blakesleeanus]|uniref:NudC domain-containing protein 1 n=2 Tax=Phycomyces blakesleeanus TaxID=4837 RepID=A0A167JUB9_PHYB8|nr:hypothetical protein PHYBLDRAFT_73531 [Phycomyces blakesleeanus NRRL 1555(-)]OAD66720.1 hypothetical protein PHYBLDRAFT_73531 [Phycomyces blakesleeanus NRRL 1555(-)]|eukprot:XP_018284760.1 hypothetical protein PHYBLDRAFT_73531 [Phycomyces blakesleeanus NRRL 1555(-)]
MITQTLTHDQDLINVAFEGYKLKTFPEETRLSRTPIPGDPLQVTQHSSQTRIGFRELQARVRFSHLADGYPINDQTGTAFYVDTEYNVVMVVYDKSSQETKFHIIGQLTRPLNNVPSYVEPEITVPLDPHYPSLIAIGQNLLVAANGVGDLEIICINQSANGTFSGCSVLSGHYEGEGNEGVSPVPFGLLAARRVEDRIVAVVYSRVAEVASKFNIATVEMNVPTGNYTSTQHEILKVLHVQRGPEVPVYVAITKDGNHCILGSESSYENIHEEPKTMIIDSDEEEKEDSNQNNDEQPKKAPYEWTQDGSDITIQFTIPQNTPKSAIACNLTHQHLSLVVQAEDVNLSFPYNKLWGPISVQDSTWTIDRAKGVLSIFLTKQDEHARWPHVFDMDDQVLESVEKERLAEMTARLAKFTTDYPESQSQQPEIASHPAATDMDEDVDEAGQPIHFLVYNRFGHLVEEIFSGGREWLSNGFRDPDNKNGLASVGVKMDVDGLVFGFEEKRDGVATTIEGVHRATFSAFAFVQASKRDSRFVRHDPYNNFAVIVESSRNAYIYHRTGTRVNTEAQTLIDLTQGHDTSVLGVQLILKNVLMVLTETEVITLILD